MVWQKAVSHLLAGAIAVGLAIGLAEGRGRIAVAEGSGILGQTGVARRFAGRRQRLVANAGTASSFCARPPLTLSA